MYRCEICGAVVPPAVAAHRVVVATRQTDYPSRHKVNHVRIGRKMTHVDDPGGTGVEIVREALVCAACARTMPAGTGKPVLDSASEPPP